MAADQSGLFDQPAPAAEETQPEPKPKKRELENLGQFTGTSAWHRWSILARDWLLTDGAQHVAETYGAYWLMDAIASYTRKLHKQPFQVWTLKVDDENRSAVLSATDGNYKKLARQEIPYTDFPDDITLYVSASEGYWVIMLPSEY
ncbi:MAG: hypothetical protein K8R77_01930 [Anaerolineaceae bacterium]|nr:hypothetical protein [Anaerolineaceae bacterium]